MQNKTKKRLASLLAAVMLITAAPVTALAEETDTPEPPAASAAAETTAPETLETPETSATAAPETTATTATADPETTAAPETPTSRATSAEKWADWAEWDEATGTLTFLGGTGVDVVDLFDVTQDESNNTSDRIKAIIIQPGYTSITAYGLEGCSNLTSVTIPDSVTSIGAYAFQSCFRLSSVTIPNGVTSIGAGTFEYCSRLTSVTIPDGVTSIGNEAFYTCRSLTSVTIPDSVTSIGYHAFRDCSSLTSVTIPNGVTSIESYTFEGCSNLTSVTIPDGVTSIGYGAFEGCSNLTSVTIPNSVTSMEAGVFRDCTSLTSVTIPSSMTEIEGYVFPNCSSLTSVTIPDSVTSIGSAAFQDCSSLTDVYYGGTEAQWQQIRIDNYDNKNDPLLNATIHYNGAGTEDPPTEDNKCGDNLTWTLVDGVLTISGTGNMWDWESTTDVLDWESIDSVPWYENISTINTVRMASGVTSIGNCAFENCSNLTSVTIPDGVTSIGDYAFWKCSSLTSVTIPNGVTSIGRCAFSNCKSLTSLAIPGSVTSIGQAAFSVCSSLTSVTILDGVTSIVAYMFDGCSSLTSVTIPNSVTDIQHRAFYACTSLTDVYYGGTEAQWQQIEIDNDNNSNAPLLNATIHYKDEGTGEEPVSYSLPAGVKYVPYSWQPEASEGTYSVVAGTLPNGLSVNGETGEVTGVPMVSGSWNFTIRHQNVDTVYTLTVEDNTNTAVQRPNDYTIVTPVGTPSPSDPNQFILYEYADRTLIIDGPYDEFMHLRIDGQLLTRDEDYTAREGSTVITIFGQTFEKFGEGTHTLSAEFRENKDPNGKLKTVSQNYTVTLTQPSKPSQPDSSGSSGSSSSNKRPSANLPKPVTPGTSGTSSTSSTPSSTPSTPSTTPSTPSTTPSTPSTTPTAPDTAASEMPFGDVPVNAWYYEDVKWAYQEEILTGVSAESFAPAVSISQATIVTVLARLGKIDLTRFEGTSDDSITAGKWYTNAAVWAKQSGILPDYSEFTGEETISRDQMAIMLVKYLRSMGKDTTPPAQAAVFADADQMSPDGNQAFQVLYQYNIFKGVGNGYMDPNGSTTRAQFTALAHRLSEIAA